MPDKYPINIFNTHTRLTQYLIAICTHLTQLDPKYFYLTQSWKTPSGPDCQWCWGGDGGRREIWRRNLEELQPEGEDVWKEQDFKPNKEMRSHVKHNMQTLSPVLFCLPKIKKHWLLLRGRALSLSIPPNLQVMILSREIIWWSETPNLWLHHTTAAGRWLSHNTACCALQSALSVLGQQLSAIDWG